MSKRQTIALVNLFITGLLAFVISMFFAQGAIAENYTDKTFVAPEFFTVLIIWGIGAIFTLFQLFKDLKPLFVASLIITWASIPVGVKIAFSIAAT